MSSVLKSNYPQIARESGFKLRQFRDGPLDWRLVGSMEIDRIIREQQFEHIDAILFHLSEAPLTSMLDSNVLDSGVAKYFTLSQLALQYLIFCRKFLDKTVRCLRENLIEEKTQNRTLKSTNEEHSTEIMLLHRKISQIEAINEIVFPCHVCTKNFISNDALNVHLSKKHLKSQSIDNLARDNDRTLINTIKLELEIKQLKERLNIAEKDIRQTVDSKKVSPREITNLSSSSQTDIQTADAGMQTSFEKTNKIDKTTTREVGTQSNLFEKKEIDSSEGIEIYNNFDDKGNENYNADNVKINKFEIISELQDKISKLETWQERKANGNNESMNEITQKLCEITSSLEYQRKQDAETLTNVAKEAILSCISSHQFTCKISQNELHSTLSNIFSQAIQINSDNIKQILTQIEKSYEQKLASLELECKTVGSNQKTETLSTHYLENINSLRLKEELVEEKAFSSHLSPKTYSIEESSKEYSNYIQFESSADAIQNAEFQILISKRKRKTKEFPKTIEQYESAMALFGLDCDSKSISVSKASKISTYLSEQRNSFKKVHPKFYATRNRLKKVVDSLTSKKLKDFKTPSSSDTSREAIRKTKQTKDLPLITKENKTFKMRLEKILRSPIQKPSSYVPNYENTQIKPALIPRKHVMFSKKSE